MQAVFCDVAALAVASLYYYWRCYHVSVVQHERALRERVAYLLWVLAGTGD